MNQLNFGGGDWDWTSNPIGGALGGLAIAAQDEIERRRQLAGVAANADRLRAADELTRQFSGMRPEQFGIRPLVSPDPGLSFADNAARLESAAKADEARLSFGKMPEKSTPQPDSPFAAAFAAAANQTSPVTIAAPPVAPVAVPQLATPTVPQLPTPQMPEMVATPREVAAATPPELAPMPSPAGRREAVAQWERDLANQPPLRAGEYQAAPVHPDDRRPLSQMEQRLQELTGVAYGQMPLHFDPRFRSQILQTMDPNGEFAARQNLQEMIGGQQMNLAQLDSQTRERVAQIEAQSRLDATRMNQNPGMDALRSDLLAKMVSGSLQADPSGASLQRTVDAFLETWPRVNATFTGGQQTAAPGQPQGVTIVNPDRQAANSLVQAIRNVASVTKQGPAGAVYELNPALAQSGGVPRLAQMYAEANLTPAGRDEFLRQLGYGTTGGVGDVNALRETVAQEAAKMYLQANPMENYPERLAVPDPNDPTRTLFELSTQPRDPLSKFGLNLYESWRRNPAVGVSPFTAIGSGLYGGRTIPYDLVTVPGRGTVEFDRSGLAPIAGVGRDAARAKASRDLDAVLRFNAAIAARQPR